MPKHQSGDNHCRPGDDAKNTQQPDKQGWRIFVLAQHEVNEQNADREERGAPEDQDTAAECAIVVLRAPAERENEGDYGAEVTY